MTWISLLPGFPCDWDLPVNRVPGLGEQGLPKHCSECRRQTQAAWAVWPGCAQGSWCSSLPAPALSCPLPFTPSLHKAKEERIWDRRCLEEEQTAVGSLCSPRAALLPGDETAEKASEAWCCSAARPSAAIDPRGLGKGVAWNWE